MIINITEGEWIHDVSFGSQKNHDLPLIMGCWAVRKGEGFQSVES